MDPDVFSALYAREADAILVFHARRTFDAETALDLTAETFAQAWRSRGRLRATTEVEVRAWLFVIARRTLGRYLRDGGVERRAMQRLGVQMPVVHEDDRREVEERAGLEELRTALGRELARLGDDQRRALQLRIVEERPYPEVARVLGVSEPTARARVSRGLRTLARALELTVPAEARG